MFIGGGACNITCGCSSTIAGGLCNSACSVYSSILGGRNNTISASFQHANVIGSCITANRSCTTFVNDLSVCSFTGSSGCSICVGSNGLLVTTSGGTGNSGSSGTSGGAGATGTAGTSGIAGTSGTSPAPTILTLGLLQVFSTGFQNMF
jgi:hypothetical protein